MVCCLYSGARTGRLSSPTKQIFIACTGPSSALGGLYVQPFFRPVKRAEDLQFHRIAQDTLPVRRRTEPQFPHPAVQLVDHASSQGGLRLEAVAERDRDAIAVLYPMRVRCRDMDAVACPELEDPSPLLVFLVEHHVA